MLIYQIFSPFVFNINFYRDWRLKAKIWKICTQTNDISSVLSITSCILILARAITTGGMCFESHFVLWTLFKIRITFKKIMCIDFLIHFGCNLTVFAIRKSFINFQRRSCFEKILQSCVWSLVFMEFLRPNNFLNKFKLLIFLFFTFFSNAFFFKKL